MDAINNPSLSHKNSTSDNIKREAVLEPSVLIQNAQDHLVSAPWLDKDGGLDPNMNGINGYELINLPPPPVACPHLLSLNQTVGAPSSFMPFPGNHQLNQLPRSHATPVTTTTYAGFDCNFQPRFRARRGQATDPHSIAERHRREKISDRIKKLHDLIPNSNKTDKASMLDEIIKYIEFLQLKIKDSGDISSSASAGSSDVVPADGTPELESIKQELCLMPVELASVISTLKGKRTAVIPTEKQVTDSALNIASLFANDGRGK